MEEVSIVARKDPAVLRKVSVSLPFGIGSAEWEADPTERSLSVPYGFALGSPDDLERATNDSNRRFELAKSPRHFHKRLADVVDPGDKSIDLVEFAVDDKVGG
jgi:hypothetical protein